MKMGRSSVLLNPAAGIPPDEIARPGSSFSSANLAPRRDPENHENSTGCNKPVNFAKVAWGAPTL